MSGEDWESIDLRAVSAIKLFKMFMKFEPFQ